MKYIYSLKDKAENAIRDGMKEDISGNIGKKAQNLKELYDSGFNVPVFSVVTDRYFKEIILKEIKSHFQEKGKEITDWSSIFSKKTEEGGSFKEKEVAETIRSIVREHKVTEEFLEELERTVDKDKYYAVRSSSIEEDSETFSFAGQFETFLYVRREEMEEKIKEVWLSSFSPHIMKYRKEGNINNEINVPSVIIQEMVNSEKAGVAFSINPVNGNQEEMVISGVFGLGTGIVDGDEDGDLYVYNKATGRTDKEIRVKNIRRVLDFENRCLREEVIDTEKEVLSEEELKELAENIISIEKYYGSPQDMEWAFEKGKLYILQSRPVTTLGKEAGKEREDEGNTIIWDNSNIVESYPEITLPLTFSFIKGAYSSVYRQFSQVVGIPEKVLEGYQPVYENMLGLLKGRVYYNLLNWYKLLLLFPNAESNSKFMEQMMGVKKGLSKEKLRENITEAEKSMTFLEKTWNKIHKLKSGLSLFMNMFLIEGKAEKFYSLINENLYNEKYDLKKMDMTELRNYYRYLENKFLKKWDIPVINDFLVMVWFGISKRMVSEYIKENPDEVHNILIAQEGEDMVSVEPSKYMGKLSGILKNDTGLQEEVADLIGSGNMGDIGKITSNMEFNSIFNEYMEKFGDRTVHELKLESPTLKENPLFLLKMIYFVSRSSVEKEHTRRNIVKEQEKIFNEMKIGSIKKYILKKSLFYAKKFVKLRENLRYERTKVFGMVRNIMKEIALHMKERKLINNERDIFYLTVNEIFGLIDGVAVDVNLKNLIVLRKKQYEKYENAPVLPDRFLTRGFLGEDFYYEDLTVSGYGEGKNDFSGNELRGTGCSKGIVRGRVRIVLNPMKTQVEEGDIVVTKSTDPSWVMVFPLISGLIVEKGSLLSHSAIISREMNIPAIVGVTGATKYLKTGDYVQFDGSTGVIKKIND